MDSYYEWHDYDDPDEYEQDIEGLLWWWGQMAATDPTYETRTIGLECISFCMPNERPPLYFVPDTTKDKKLLLRHRDRIRYLGQGRFKLVRSEE